jgi:hypothetical protein
MTVRQAWSPDVLSFIDQIEAGEQDQDAESLRMTGPRIVRSSSSIADQPVLLVPPRDNDGQWPMP